MNNATTEHVNDAEWKESFSMAKSAASFLLRALQDLRLVDDTITVEDLQAFADEIRDDMDLMIGSEEKLRGIFNLDSEMNFLHIKSHYEVADQLSEKILQAQQNLITNDRDLPFLGQLVEPGRADTVP